MTSAPSFDQILEVIAKVLQGETMARVPLSDRQASDDLPTRLGTALNALMDKLAADAADSQRDGQGPERVSSAQLAELAVSEATLRSLRTKADEHRFRLAAIVDSSDDAIIGKTLEGVITSWNEGAFHIFGYTSDEVVGKSITLLLPPDRLDEERAILEKLARGERVHHLETIRVRKDGVRIHVSVTSSPVRDSTGTITGASKIARDITERRRAAEALERAKEAADAANRELEAFSYSVAHDLRAPLRGMNGFAQVLLDTYESKLDAAGQDWLQEILLNAKKMSLLIDALLALARLTRTEPKLERTDLSALARAALAELAASQPDRRIEIVVEKDLWAHVDPTLARAVVQNLLDNAWKFTSKVPGARIEFGAVETAGLGAFFVRDNGAGFDTAFADKLFVPFQRLHTVEEFPGTGIGLATVQRIVRRHGGRVWAESTLDAGATFYFTLPKPADDDLCGPPGID